MPCCWLEGEVEPAVAKVAEDLKEEEVAGCLGEEVEVASYPLEVAADPLGVHAVQVPGPWEEEGAASRVEASHWGWEA